MQEMRVQVLGWEDDLEESMATHSNILASRLPWTAEPGELQSMGSQRAGHDWNDLAQISTREESVILSWVLKDTQPKTHVKIPAERGRGAWCTEEELCWELERGLRDKRRRRQVMSACEDLDLSPEVIVSLWQTFCRQVTSSDL